MKPFRFGVQVSQCDSGAGWRDKARKLEDLGYSTLFMPDHFGEELAPLPAIAMAAAHSTTLRIGSLEIDPAGRATTVRGRRVELAAKEFALLRTLASAPTRVFTKDELLRDVWGFRAAGSTRTLDSHACRLRQKLRVDGDEFVVNVWGVGYRLVDGPHAIGLPARSG